MKIEFLGLSFVLGVVALSCGTISQVKPVPVRIGVSKPIVIKAKKPTLTPEEFSYKCAEIIDATAQGLPFKLDWKKVRSPVEEEHNRHKEFRHGAALGGLPAVAFWVGVTLNTPREQFLFPPYWHSALDHEQKGADRTTRLWQVYPVEGGNIRLFKSIYRKTKMRALIPFDADLNQYERVSYRAVNQQGHCRAEIRLGIGEEQKNIQKKLGVSVDPKKMIDAFEKAADKCLQLCEGIRPTKPVIVDDVVPICQTELFPKAVPETVGKPNLSDLSISILKESYFNDKEYAQFPKAFGRPQIEIIDSVTMDIVNSFKLPKFKQPGWEMGELIFNDAFTHFGDFIIRLTWPKSQHDQYDINVHIEPENFNIELRISIESLKVTNTKTKTVQYPYSITNASSTKIQPAKKEIKLLRNWKFNAQGEPSYIIWNDSSDTIYGVAYHNLFLGKVHKWNGTKWELFYTGDHHGMIGGNRMLEPGEVTKSWQGGYIEERPIYTPGKYRYSVRYTKENNTISNPYRLIEPATKESNHFELTDIFIIPNPSSD